MIYFFFLKMGMYIPHGWGTLLRSSESDPLFKKSPFYIVSRVFNTLFSALFSFFCFHTNRQLVTTPRPRYETAQREQDKSAICNLPTNFTWFTRARSAGMVFPSC